LLIAIVEEVLERGRMMWRGGEMFRESGSNRRGGTM